MHTRACAHFDEVGVPLHVDGWFRPTPKSASAPPAPVTAVSPATPVASDTQQPPKPSLFQRLTGKDKKKSTDVTNLSNQTLSTKSIYESQPWTTNSEGSYHYAILTIFNEKHFVFLAISKSFSWKYDQKGRRKDFTTV